MHRDRKCLSELELAAYMEGRLSQGGKEAIDKCLSECVECRDEFLAINNISAMKDGLPPGEVPEYLIKKAVGMYPGKKGLFDAVVGIAKDSIKVLYCLPDIRAYIPSPAFYLRNARILSPRMIILTRSFSEIEVELDVEKVADNLCNIKVIVADIKTKALMNNLRVELVSGGRELASSPLEDGEVIFEDVGPGLYLIKVYRNGAVFGELTIKLE